MLFNSIQFFIFFPAVYCLYLLLKHRQQNKLLIAASCFFYAAWNWKFLLLMFISISVDYFCSRRIYAASDIKTRKRFLFLSLLVNLSILGFFKYFNFFAESLGDLISWFFPSLNLHPVLNIILPVGISFYTFEAMSYVIDVYRGVAAPAQRYWDYVLFVIYFPHLIAGPIMRAKDFLPQITSPRKITLDQFYEGCFLTFWGLFEKVFVADNLARIVNPVFASNTIHHSGGEILLAVYAFAFQIFCDFDGYSNIARGLGKCMGFEITINFNLPYFSTSPMEFWRRWHISLSSWLRDYLYIPLGGNQGTTLMTFRNLMITMLLGGLWHGASWTFVLWGGYHGFLLIIYRLLAPCSGRWFSGIVRPWSYALTLIQMIIFFHLTCLGWLIFRATSIPQLEQTLVTLTGGLFDGLTVSKLGDLAFFIIPILAVQIVQYWRNDLMTVLRWPIWLRAAMYVFYFYLFMIWGIEGGKEFIYFQF